MPVDRMPPTNSKVALELATIMLLLTACGSSRVGTSRDGFGQIDAGVAISDAAVLRDAARPDATPAESLAIAPSGVLSIESLAPRPISFTSQRRDGSPSNIPVTWSARPRAIGTIDTNTGVFTPSGVGGKVTIGARAGTLSGTLEVDVNVRVTQDGDPDFGKMPAGAGGIGGVGGEGGGSQIFDPAVRAALDTEPSVDASLTWLYPYDGTVWPRGLPAPLLQWKNGARAAVAVKLTITAGAHFSSTVSLGPPMGKTQIERLPMPQAVWRNGQLSGDVMKVSLTYVASDGAGGYKAYKMQRELTWKIAPTDLKGVLYYNSYGTKLAENFGGAVGGNGRFGGATLAVEGDSFDPRLVAGSNENGGCRVCHTVSSDGSTLITQRKDGMESSIYDLRSSVERMAPPADDGKFGWAALYPDGSVALGASGPPGVGQGGKSSRDATALYRVSDGAVLSARGLSETVTQAATPAFSADGSKVVFNLHKGTGTATAPADGKSLFMLDVARLDANSFDFSNPTPIFTATGKDKLPCWPFFLPDHSGVVFELELAPGQGLEHYMTRLGARGELWWTDLYGNAHALDAANGKGYLPTGDNEHGDDATLQYEPTVAPIVAGGYVWVVFTSRRLYGNVATRKPFESDPRVLDLTPGNSGGPTTKKLWVAAIDVPPKPGTDPSHPAFYLPAQELFAGNSRGFWTLDVCKPDGAQCEGGDECCGGYCSVVTEFGVCGTNTPNACAKEYDKCNVDADCCRGGPALTCMGGYCATSILL